MSKEATTYLVTGGAGFIGSNFVKYLLSEYAPEKIRIVILDLLTYAGNPATIAPDLENPGVTFVRGDINDYETVKRVFDEFDPDFVVNFAAESHVDRSIKDPRPFVITNVEGTQTLLERARAKWTRDDGSTDQSKRFLQVSTDEVYGSLKRDFDEPKEISRPKCTESQGDSLKTTRVYGEGLFTETTPLAPRSPYAASKASADLIALAYSETFGLPVTVTRCSNNYGPYQFPEKLIPLIINNLRQGRKLPVYGRGLNVRDWLFVGDHVRAIDHVLRHGKSGEVYNIGGLNETDNITIVRRIIDIYAELTGTTPRYDLIEFVADRPGHDMRYAIDPTKTASQLGWYPRTSFEEGIRRTVKWYLDNTDWIDSVTSGEYRKYYSEMYDNR